MDIHLQKRILPSLEVKMAWCHRLPNISCMFMIVYPQIDLPDIPLEPHIRHDHKMKMKIMNYMLYNCHTGFFPLEHFLLRRPHGYSSIHYGQIWRISLDNFRNWRNLNFLSMLKDILIGLHILNDSVMHIEPMHFSMNTLRIGFQPAHFSHSHILLLCPHSMNGLLSQIFLCNFRNSMNLNFPNMWVDIRLGPRIQCDYQVHKELIHFSLSSLRIGLKSWHFSHPRIFLSCPRNQNGQLLHIFRSNFRNSLKLSFLNNLEGIRIGPRIQSD